MWFGNKTIEEQSENQKNRILLLNEKFRRWQDKQLALSTFVINLLLSISIAGVGLLWSNSSSDQIKNFRCHNEILFKLSIYCLTVSILFGVIALILRLNDYRLTKEIIKWRKLQLRVNENLRYEWDYELDEETCASKIRKIRKKTKNIGIVTWWFFYLQITALTLSVIGLTTISI